MLGTIIAAGFGSLLLSNPRKRRKSRRRRNPQTAFDVFLRGKKIDTVFQSHGDREKISEVAEEVRRGLINHDGYDSDIKVRKAKRRNPETEVHELVLYITNDSTLYRQQAQPIIKNLQKKIAKGTYDAGKAVKLWGYLANSGAQKYTKEFGGSGNGSYGSFSAADRRAAAKELQESYEEELRSTNPHRRRRSRRR